MQRIRTGARLLLLLCRQHPGRSLLLFHGARKLTQLRLCLCLRTCCRCYPLQGSAKACRTSGKGSNSTTCLLRQAMCLETVCDAKGEVSAVFKFNSGKDVVVPCPSGVLCCH